MGETGGFSEFERRVERLRARASRGLTRGLAVEIEGALAEGYLLALRGDARGHRLREHLAALVTEADARHASAEVRRLERERRALEQHVRGLRERLAHLRSLMARAVGPRDRSA